MNLLLSVSVVFPLCIYILIGVLGARLKLLDQKLASSMNAFVFKLLFPLMMFENVIKARDALMNGAGRAVLFIFSVFAVSFTLLRLLVPLFIKDKPRQASFIQGSFRANTILFAVPVISALCGEDETGLAAMCVAATVPFCNAACVVLLETSRGGRAGFGKLLLSVLKNPLVIGAIAGCLFLLTGWHLPSLLSVPLKAVTGIITPLSLMLLGAGLRFRGILQDAGQLLIVCFIKLVLTPALSLWAALRLGFVGVPLITVFVLSCVPTAVSSFTMAEQLGADGPFAAEVVASTTTLSMFTVFGWVLLLSSMGLVG